MGSCTVDITYTKQKLLKLGLLIKGKCGRVMMGKHGYNEYLRGGL